MIVEFRVKNFRSIKDDSTLSFEANRSHYRAANLISNGDRLLLPAIAIYGANASGKTNILKALHALRFMIMSSARNEVDASLDSYEPFLFDQISETQPSEFDITFIVAQKVYNYFVVFARSEILKERLVEQKPDSEIEIFFREANGHRIHAVKQVVEVNIKRELLENQLYLSLFSTEPHELLNSIFLFFKNIDIQIHHPRQADTLNKSIAKDIVRSNNVRLKKQLTQLVKVADIKVVDIEIKQVDENEFQFPSTFPEELRERIIDENKWLISFMHHIYQDGIQVGMRPLQLDHESAGTQLLFGLGARVLKTLDSGGILAYDEFNSSLHPELSHLLLSLFLDREINVKGAQLLITTHDATIIDSTLIRYDQLWFVEKDHTGCSELFSAADFEGVKDGVPLGSWYKAGRFGALPSLQNVKSIFD